MTDYRNLWPSLPMTSAERREFARKAKADRLVFEAAGLLARSEPDRAASLVRDAIALVGPERVAFWLRHYARAKFKVAGSVVEEFLRSVTAVRSAA